MTAAKWEDRHAKQVQANNLLSDKLRETRKVGQQMIDNLKMAYSEKTTECINAQMRIRELELMLGGTDEQQTDR